MDSWKDGREMKKLFTDEEKGEMLIKLLNVSGTLRLKLLTLELGDKDYILDYDDKEVSCIMVAASAINSALLILQLSVDLDQDKIVESKNFHGFQNNSMN